MMEMRSVLTGARILRHSGKGKTGLVSGGHGAETFDRESVAAAADPAGNPPTSVRLSDLRRRDTLVDGTHAVKRFSRPCPTQVPVVYEDTKTIGLQMDREKGAWPKGIFWEERKSSGAFRRWKRCFGRTF